MWKQAGPSMAYWPVYPTLWIPAERPILREEKVNITWGMTPEIISWPPMHMHTMEYIKLYTHQNCWPDFSVIRNPLRYVDIKGLGHSHDNHNTHECRELSCPLANERTRKLSCMYSGWQCLASKVKESIICNKLIAAWGHCVWWNSRRTHKGSLLLLVWVIWEWFQRSALWRKRLQGRG